MSWPARGFWRLLAGAGGLLLAGAGIVGMVYRGMVGAWPVLMIAWPIVGGLLIARRPQNMVGRLLVLFSVVFGIAAAVEVYLDVGLTIRSLPNTDLALWLTSWAFVPFFLILMLLVAVFPTGRVTSSWVRWPLRIGVALVALSAVARAILPVPVADNIADDLINPWGLEELAWLVPIDGVVFWFVLGVLVVLIVDLVMRWRRSQGIERLQMQWLALVLTVFAFSFVVTTGMRLAGTADHVLDTADTIGWLSGLLLLPIAIGLAVTRYRLYDIDRIISRTVTYGLVVAVLASVFAVVAIGLPQLLGMTSNDPLLIAAATLAVAALFNPLRRRLQTRIDRRFNRARYDAQQEVDRFAERLRTELKLDDLTGEVLGVIGRTMEPATASVWIRVKPRP